MPSVESTRAGDFWLAAHDGVQGALLIGDWALGTGLAAALLAELVHGGHCDMEQVRLFRTAAPAPRDPALLAVLNQMRRDETEWPPPRSPATYVGAHARGQSHGGWPAMVRDDGSRPPVPQQIRGRGPGHEVREYMSWLAYEGRADKLVRDRLARHGLVRREARRRLLGGTTVRYVPYDSVVSGTPANSITIGVQRLLTLSPPELFLAGLFFATGLHEHALAPLTPTEHQVLQTQLSTLDERSGELLRAADAAVGDAAIR